MRQPRPIELEDVPGGPPPGTLIARTKDIPKKRALTVSFRESDRGPHFDLLLIRYEGQVRAFQNSCPHHSLTLDKGDGDMINGRGQLVCAHHDARFSMDTGLCVRGPCKGDYLRSVAVMEIDGGIVSI